MGIVVQKYGGSSVADTARIRQVAERVVRTRREGHDVVVVVSAMGNTTNELLDLAREVSPRPGRREIDMLISVGERISMALLSMAISDLGAPALSFTGSQSGIITDESHANARIVAVRPGRVRKALEDGYVAIVAGFQGVSREREVTTLGRGGTDLTAVALAAALGAEWCEICSDVDGIYSADPRVVPEAIRLDRVSLDEALALARSGSRVLYNEAVAYAHRQGIELAASATTEDRPGTRIQVPALPPRVAAIAADDMLEGFAGDALEPMLRALQGTGAAVRSASANEGGALVVVDVRNWHDRAAFEPPKGSRSLGPMAQVAAVGSGATVEPALVLAALEALRAVGVPTGPVEADAAVMRFTVPAARLKDAERALHHALIEDPPVS